MDGDADLVARVRRGDRQAFDDLYDRYADDVFSMCLVVLGDPTVARAAAGTAFALVARTRMNPLSDPSRLRSWLLELARGSALAWSGSPQARSVPVPHGVSAESMIEGAVVPAPASLRAGLARTFDRASSAAAHERLAARDTGREVVPQPRTTETATGPAAAATPATSGADSPAAAVPPAADPAGSERRRTVAGATAVGSTGTDATAGVPDTATGAPGAPAIPHARTVATPGHGPAGTRPAGEPATAHGHQAQTAAGTSAAIAGDTAAAGDTAGAVQPARTAGRFSRKAAGHGTRPGGHQAAADQPAPTAASGLGGSQRVQLIKRPDAPPDDAGVDPPTVTTGLASNVVPLGAAYQDDQHDDHQHDDQQHDSHQRYYADGHGAPLVPIDDLEARHDRAAVSDWRTRPAIAVAASLVVAVAGITAALNWPTPSANLSAENFPDAAIVAPSLTAKATAAAPSSPPEATPASTTPPAVDVPYAQPRPVVNQRLIATTTPHAPSAGDAPTPPPATTSSAAPTTPSSPPRTPPVTGTPTPSPTGPARTSPPPAGAPTSPVATQSAATTQPARPTQSAAAAASTPVPPRPTVVGTLNSGSTANM